MLCGFGDLGVFYGANFIAEKTNAEAAKARWEFHPTHFKRSRFAGMLQFLRVRPKLAGRRTTSPTPMVRYTESEPTDDSQFLDWVEAVVVGVEREIKTDHSFVVKIDNWFGKRWLGFSGKALGALGIHKTKLTLPPFIPSRVVSQRRFWGEASHPGRRKRLHTWQRSGENLQRYAEVLLPRAHAFWYSGRSASNDRASFMAFVSTLDGHWPWYVSLRRKETWRVVECVGIAVPELDAFARRGIERLRESHESQGL